MPPLADNGGVSTRALILFVHGSRDPRWAEPFRRLQRRVAEREPGLPVEVAFLEHGSPDLVAAAQALAAAGATSIRVVPVFFGRGGHLRNDLPRAIDAVRRHLPGVALDVCEAAGESDRVLDALADFALGGQNSSR